MARITSRPESICLPLSRRGNLFLLYVFEHEETQRAVWLEDVTPASDPDPVPELDHPREPRFTWWCSCGARAAAAAGPIDARPLTVELLREAWDHFDDHVDPPAVPLGGGIARWYRGGREPDLDATLQIEVERILGREPEIPVEVVHLCGICGEHFHLTEDDPHFATGRGPLCPEQRDGRSTTTRE